MLISQYESRTGKEKVIANEEKGRRGVSPRFQRHQRFFSGGAKFYFGCLHLKGD